MPCDSLGPMSPLPNPRHEAFARARVEGMTADAAYAAAGYAPNRSNASRLAHDHAVVARVAALQGAVTAKVVDTIAEAVAETVAKITAELNEALVMARAQGRPDRMIAASLAKARVNGLIVEKSESTVTHKHEERVARRQELLKQRRDEGDSRDPSAVH